jgi:hypothetical protein
MTTAARRRKRNQMLARRRIITKAIRRGAVTRGSSCEICGEPCDQLQAHHWSYAKRQRLRVSFVCQECHTAIHTALLAGEAVYPHPAMIRAGERPPWGRPRRKVRNDAYLARQRARGLARARWNRLMLVSIG